MKYKIKYKGLDTPDAEAIVKAFYRNHLDYNVITIQQQVYDDHRHAIQIDYISRSTHKEGFVFVDFTHKEIGKFDYRTFIEFYPDELKLFDTLGFSIIDEHARKTGQDITDWWGKV